MKTFRVDLSRTYAVEITAKDADEARHLAEFYVGTPGDCGTEAERKAAGYEISNVELTNNEAIFVEEIEE